MSFKRGLAFGLLLVFTTLSVSCSTGSGSQKAGADQSESLKSGGSKELTMYVMDYDTTAQKAIEKFNSTHKNVQIKPKSLVAIPADNLGSRLMYELNSGAGPDIILCEQSTLPNLSVFFNKGSFYDLNTLIDNDKSFRKTDYFEKVMEYGFYKDKRYVMPLSFKIDSLYTTKKILGRDGQGIIEAGAGITQFAEASEKHLSAAAANGKYFISNLDFGSLMQTAAVPFYNLEKKAANFNSADFGNLLDNYKKLSESSCLKEMIASPVDVYSMLSSDKTVFADIQTMGPRYAADAFGSFNSEVEPVIMPPPYADNSRHIIAKPEKYIGINSKCGNVKAAFDFVKLMLSKDYQDIDVMEGIPVNREVYEQEKENCLKGLAGYDSWKKGGCKKTDTLKTLYTQLDALLEGIDRCWTTDEYVLGLVKEKVNSYLQSNSTKENTLKAIQEKVEAYLKGGIMVQSVNKEDNAPTDPAKTVSLYYWDIPCYVDNAEYLFKQQYPDLNIKRKTFKSISEFYNTTAIEIMAGGGPDIIIFSPRYFNSMPKTVQTGAFCEMDDYIKKYEILNGDYNKNLLQEGIFNGKRYYLPVNFYNNFLVSYNEILDKNKIKIPENGWSWELFAEYALSYSKANKSKYFVAGLDFVEMVKSCDTPLIDYKNNKSNFNSEAFKKLLKLYRDMYPAMDPEYNYSFSASLKSERNVFYASSCPTYPLAYRYYYEDIRDYISGTLTVIPYPTLSGVRKYHTIPNDCIAVNSKCKNKDIAFKYVKIAVSYEMQRDRDSRGKPNSTFTTPFNDKSAKDDMLSYPVAKALPELTEKMIEIRGSFEPCLVREYNIRQMTNDIAEKYREGTKTLDQAAKEMDDKVNVYLNE